MVSDADRIKGTDMADHAVAALRDSTIDEVVILGRRGPADAARTAPELLALTQLRGVEMVIDARKRSRSRPPPTAPPARS